MVRLYGIEFPLLSTPPSSLAFLPHLFLISNPAFSLGVVPHTRSASERLVLMRKAIIKL